MITFLSCRAKSQKIVEKFLALHPTFRNIVTGKLYYSYLKLVKENMHKCLLEDNIDKLFQYYDLSFKIFTRNEQIVFIRINIFLMKYYSRHADHYPGLISSRRIWKSTVKEYLRASRVVLERVEYNLSRISQNNSSNY